MRPTFQTPPGAFYNRLGPTSLFTACAEENSRAAQSVVSYRVIKGGGVTKGEAVATADVLLCVLYKNNEREGG